MGVLAGQFYELRYHQKSFKIIFWTFNFTFRNLISLIPFDCWGKTYQIHCVFQRMPLYLAIFIILKIFIYNKQVSFSISLHGSRLHFPVLVKSVTPSSNPFSFAALTLLYFHSILHLWHAFALNFKMCLT